MPLAGVTESQAGAVVSVVAVQLKVPPPLLAIAIVWLTGFVPWRALKLRLVGVRTIVGAGNMTVRVTLIDCGVLVAPVAAMVTVFMYVPAAREALLTANDRVPFPVPLAGVTDNQVGMVASAVAVQFMVPPPLLAIAIV